MKKLLIIFTLTACAPQKYEFASFMRVKVEPYIYCDGLTRNYLGFGYYQVDALWCQVNQGSLSIPSKIIHEGDMQQYWDHFDDYHYSPANLGTDLNRRYFEVGPQKWIKAEPHIIGVK